MDLNQIVNNVKLSKTCSISPDKDSNESKSINLEVTFDNVTLADVFTKAMSQTVIAWQNGIGRKKFTDWTDKQSVKVQFKAPASSTIDPEAHVGAKLAAMETEAEVEAYIAKLREDYASK